MELIEKEYYKVLSIRDSDGSISNSQILVVGQTGVGKSTITENIVEEFCYIKKNFPQVKEIFIEDDTFTVNKKQCQAIAHLLIKEKVRLNWTANSRVDVDLETLKLMKEAGCRLLCIGIESGDQQILDNIKKGIILNQIKTFVENAKKAKILVHGCFMVGNRGETKESMQKTLEFAKGLKLDTAQFFPIMVYPGTEAYNWAKEQGYLTTQDYSCWVTDEGLHNCVMNTPQVSSQELVEFCDYARKTFYLRPEYILSKSLQMLFQPYEAKRLFRSLKTFKKYLIR